MYSVLRQPRLGLPRAPAELAEVARGVERERARAGENQDEEDAERA